MTTEELTSIIQKIESSNDEKEAYFDTLDITQGPDEYLAKANQQGLELYALQFLKAAREFESIIDDPERDYIYLNYDLDWMKGNIFIDHIDPVRKKPEGPEENKHTETFMDKLIPIGCLLAFIFIATSMIVGFISIVKWIFS